MSPWTDDAARLFNPEPRINVVPITHDQNCYVIDDMLADPERWVEWACASAFERPGGYPYPGVVADVPQAVQQRVADHFIQHLRRPLGARRMIDLAVRLSMVTVPPAHLEPRQWQCHRDRVTADPGILFAASVLYLFRDPALGGTSFYVPRHSPEATDRMIADSQSLDARTFSARYGVAPGYMAGSNGFFEQVAKVPAAWNRAIFYNGGVFHSADVDQPTLLNTDPQQGRLTLNGFFTCRRNAG